MSSASSVTIKDVARVAGVSPSTVSRVISDHPQISPRTKKKVRQVMSELGYHPNLMAKSLVSQYSRTLGLIMPSTADGLFANPFFSEVLRGMLVYANLKQYDLLMSAARNQSEELEVVTRMVKGRRVDGIILMSARTQDPVIEKLLEYEFPFIVLGRTPAYPEILSVNNDNIAAGADITNYLLKQGHRKIGFLSANPKLVVTNDRFEGYSQALKAANIAVDERSVIQGDSQSHLLQTAVDLIGTDPSPPTAFVITDDVLAFAFIRKLYDAGFRVPDSIAIASFNNIVLSELSNPPITTMDIGIYDLGFTVVESLVKSLQTEDIQERSVIIPHQLIVRRSS